MQEALAGLLIMGSCCLFVCSNLQPCQLLTQLSTSRRILSKLSLLSGSGHWIRSICTWNAGGFSWQAAAAFIAAFVLVAAGLILYSRPDSPGAAEGFNSDSSAAVCTQSGSGACRPEADDETDALRHSTGSSGALQEMSQEETRPPDRTRKSFGVEGSDRVELLALKSRHVV